MIQVSSNIPVFSGADLQTLLTQMDIAASADMVSDLGEDIHNRTSVLIWLKAYDKGLHAAIENCEEIWMQAFNTAYDQTSRVVNTVSIFRADVRALQKRVREGKRKLNEKQARPSKERKESAVEVDSEELGTLQALFDSSERGKWVHKKEPWIGQLDVTKLKDGRSSKSVEYLSNVDTFKTLYHCTSFSNAEELCKILKKEAVTFCLVRDTSKPVDLDMIRWKVISNECYKPSEVKIC